MTPSPLHPHPASPSQAYDHLHDQPHDQGLAGGQQQAQRVHHHHHGHDHHHAAQASHLRLLGALLVTVTAMVVGVIGGLWSGSLALIADAGHMLADAGSLGLALLAARQALREADANHSYGHVRLPVLAAFVNGLLLLAASAWITYEAATRIYQPRAIDGGTMTLIAGVGLVANLISLALLHGGESEDLNRRGAAAHVLSDLLGSVAALIAGLIILATGWQLVDPLLSFLAAALVLRIGLRICHESAHILLEGTPRGMDLQKISNALPDQVAGLVSVHHLHAWSLSQTKKLMTLHAVPDGSVSSAALIAAIRGALERHGITHVTIQLEPAAGCGDAACDHRD